MAYFIFISVGKNSGDDEISEATWTPRGNIAYVTKYIPNKLVVMSNFGKVIAIRSNITSVQGLSIFNDIMYLTGGNAGRTGVYESIDDGISWNCVFESTDDWQSIEVIKVSTGQRNDYWTLENWQERRGSVRYHLRVYSVDRIHTGGNNVSLSNFTWKDVNITTVSGEYIDLSFINPSLSYDGNMYIFFSNYFTKTVYALSVNDQFICQTLIFDHIKNEPSKLTVDSKRQLLYLGQTDGVLAVFQLTYWNA